jgi:hypothetical protein
VPPNRIAPPVADLGALGDIVLVDFDAQARASGNGDEAFRVVEHRPIRQIIEQVIADVVVDAEALLLNEGVVGTPVDLQAGGERNRAERTVQRHGNVVRLGHGGDLAGLGNAAGVRGVGLDDVDGPTGQDRLEVPSRVEPFTKRDRCAGVDHHAQEGVSVFGQHRLLDEHQPEGPPGRDASYQSSAVPRWRSS